MTNIAPRASRPGGGDAMNGSFFRTNIAPRAGSGFNRHIWKPLECRARQRARQHGVPCVVAGPHHERTPVGRIAHDEDGDGKDDSGILTDVPTRFLKPACDPHGAEAIAFLLPNRKSRTRDLPLYLASLGDTEDRSRLEFPDGDPERAQADAAWQKRAMHESHPGQTWTAACPLRKG